MRIIVILFTFIVSLMAADAAKSAKLLGYENDYKRALAKAKQANKMVLLIIVQDPCPYCDRLVKETLNTPCTARRMKSYVPVIVDKHSALPEQFKPPMIPFTFVVDPGSEEATWEIVGAVPFSDYVQDLDDELEFRHIK